MPMWSAADPLGGNKISAGATCQCQAWSARLCVREEGCRARAPADYGLLERSRALPGA